MPNVLAQATLPYRTGIPEDVSVNTWSFEIADDTESELIQVASFLGVFYAGIMPYYSEVVNPTQFNIKIYDRADAEPRTPIFTQTGDIGVATSTGGMPEEVAVCLSFSGVLESGAPPARRRGRVYLGPLAGSVVDLSDTNGRAFVDGAFASDVLDSYELAWEELTTAGNVHEAWSPTDNVGHPVVTAWMDNAFDTQRRRGVAATARSTRTGPF